MAAADHEAHTPDPKRRSNNERLVAMWGAKSVRIVVGSRHWSSIAPNNTFTNTSSSILTQQASQRAHLQVFDVGLVRANRGAASCTASLLLLDTGYGRSMSCTGDSAGTSGMILRILAKIRYLLDTLGACFRVLT